MHDGHGLPARHGTGAPASGSSPLAAAALIGTTVTKAYGFAFDDVGAHESLVHNGDPRQAYITLDPFAGAGRLSPARPAPANRLTWTAWRGSHR